MARVSSGDNEGLVVAIGSLLLSYILQVGKLLTMLSRCRYNITHRPER